MEVACSQSNCTQLLVEYDKGLQRLPELERRQQICVACRFLHEVQYHTMSSITAAVAATDEEQVSPHHPPCVYKRTAVQQKYNRKGYPPTTTVPTCVHNNSTAALHQKKIENAETGRLN